MVDKWHVYLARRAYTYYIKILIKIFHFDMWHIVPLYKKLYAVDIVRYLNNSVQRNTLVEIGCGLGDILRNVKYKSREGYDSSIDVLRAARFISRLSFKSGIVYKIFDFEVDDLNKSYDAIILVNWIHNVEPEVLLKRRPDQTMQNLTEQMENYSGLKVFFGNRVSEIRGNRDVDKSVDEMVGQIWRKRFERLRY